MVPISPLVSILIPCYNAEQWIAQSIQSALDQTYLNKEIIVVDDGSSDASADVIDSFGDAISFHRLSHAGGNSARNHLTQLARGEWLQFLDADDYLLPGKLASQIECVERSASKVDVVYSPVIIQDTERPGKDFVSEITDDDESLTFIRWGPVNTGGLLLRRKAVLELGGWKEDQPCCQEHEVLLRFIMAGKRFLLHRRAEAVYRQHGTETVSHRDPLRVIRTRMELSIRLAEYLQSTDRLTTDHRKALYVAGLECARSASSKDPDLAEQLSRTASSLGRWWVSASPALPISYQIVYRVAGFRFTERVAAWVRNRHARNA